MARLGVVFDIVLNLFALCIPKTNDSSDFASINERHVVKRAAFRDQADHSEFIVLVSVFDPDRGLAQRLRASRSDGAKPHSFHLFGHIYRQ